ncbi:hypothetical protein BHE74_00057122 [Ensete ventricosum]|nr:hypothetical protein BHE74_00057122 [Ensete ventricosum]
MLWDFSAVTEESAWPSPCRVRKLIHVSRWRGCSVWVGSTSRELTPRENRSPLVLPEGGFILTGRKLDRTPGLTSTVTSGMVTLYGELVGAEAWREGVVHHTTFMAHDGSSAGAGSDQFHLGCRRGYGAGTGPSLTRMLTWLLS